MKTLLAAVLSAVVLGTAAQAAAPAAAAKAAPVAAAPAAVWSDANPFAHVSPLPYHLPPFDKIHDADYVPAFEKGMAEQRKEVNAIAHNKAAPTFENTVLALERSGRVFDRVATTFDELNESNADDAMQKIDADMAPRRAAHSDAIYLDPALFARVDELYKKRAELKLDPESDELLARQHLAFVRAGAGLSEMDKAQVRSMNERLSTLTTLFKQNLLKARKDGAVIVSDVKELDGMPAEEVAAAAAAAKERGLDGKWLIALVNTTIQASMNHLKNRDLRRRIQEASEARGIGGPDDATAMIAEIVKLRAQRAKLLGYTNHAAYDLADENAGTPEAVNGMLRQIADAARAAAKREAAEIQGVIDAQAKASKTKPFALEPYDWAFYSEQVRKAKFDFDEGQVKPYFELERVMRDGLFYAAREMYGLTFKERKDLPSYAPGVRTFEVFDADGSPLALFIADYFARDNKQGGAWMSSYVNQSKEFGEKPVVVNNLNLTKPGEGQPVLMSFDEVTGMFHEFGHGLHGMLSNVRYESLSGTDVERDFVEYPSQFNEMWAREPAVLSHYAHDYRTGAPMPKALFDKVLAAARFNQGFETFEYVAAAMLDQSWHQIPAEKAPAADGVMAFESAALKDDGVDYAPIPPRYHSPYFSHIFAGGYAAAYYAYIWSEVLARDSGAWFHAHGGLSRANGDVFRAKILSRGHSRETKDLFQDFYGKAPEIGPLLEYRGLNAQ
ncbi:MAG: M3 family metallopeptidase [Elusimicrobiota bacterium]